MLSRALVVAALCASGVAHAADQLVIDLQRRLVATDVATVNAHLSANWATKMARLGRLVRSCDREAIGLSVRLLDTTNLEALQSHVFNLELAMGRCPERVLPITPATHVKALCSVNAYMEMHPAAKPLPELDRRVVQLRRSDALAKSANGPICLDAYSTARQQLQ